MSKVVATWTDETFNTGQDVKRTCPIRFEVRAKFNQSRTEIEGRECFDDEEIIVKMPSNDRSLEVAKPVRLMNRQEMIDYGELLRNWRATKQNTLVGFPIENWPSISIAQKEELKSLKIRTVEALANLSDEALQRIMGGNSLRKMAQDFIGQSNQAEVIAKIKSEASAENSALKQQLADQAGQLAHLTALMERLTATQPEPSGKNTGK